MVQVAVGSFTSGLIFWSSVRDAHHDLRANTPINLWSRILPKQVSYFASNVADILCI